MVQNSRQIVQNSCQIVQILYSNTSCFLFFLDQVVANLFNILEREGSPEQIGSALRPLIRRNNEAGSDIKKSLHELETIINYAQSLGVKAKIIISPGLIFQSEHFRFVSLIL